MAIIMDEPVNFKILLDSYDRDRVGYEIVCFDRVLRRFWPQMPDMRSDPERYVPIHVIYYKDIYTRFLRIFGYHSFLEENCDISDKEFERRVRMYADEHMFEDKLNHFVSFYLYSYYYDWIQEHGIENMKPTYDPFIPERGFYDLPNKERVRRMQEFNIEQVHIEMIDEDMFKEDKRRSKEALNQCQSDSFTSSKD